MITWMCLSIDFVSLLWFWNLGTTLKPSSWFILVFVVVLLMSPIFLIFFLVPLVRTYPDDALHESSCVLFTVSWCKKERKISAYKTLSFGSVFCFLSLFLFFSVFDLLMFDVFLVVPCLAGNYWRSACISINKAIVQMTNVTSVALLRAFIV